MVAVHADTIAGAEIYQGMLQPAATPPDGSASNAVGEALTAITALDQAAHIFCLPSCDLGYGGRSSAG